MKLTKDDKAILLASGYRKSDLPQIEEAMNRATYTLDYKDGRGTEHIIASEAREILGDREFLSGIGRAAFHWNCCRDNADQSKRVCFDCKILFR